MFRNAIASSSKLPQRYASAVQRPCVGSSAPFASSSRANFDHSPARFAGPTTGPGSMRDGQSALPETSTDFDEPAVSSAAPFTVPSRRQPASRGPPGGRVMPSITSLSSSSSPLPSPTSLPSALSSRNVPSGPALRWDPTRPIDETPTTHTLTVTSTRNNLLLTLSDRQGPLFGTISAGTGKTFKNSQRSGFEAAHQASLKMFEKLLDLSRRTPVSRTAGGGVKLRVAYKGFSGQGGEAFSQALSGNEGGEVRRLVVKIEDRTGIKIGGTRPKRARRL